MNKNNPTPKKGAIFQTTKDYLRWLSIHRQENPKFDPKTYQIKINKK